MASSHQLPRSTPEAQGIPSPAILSFVQAVNETIRDLHSFMLLRHGHVVAEGWWEPFARECPHVLFSLSKSFASTAVGLAIEEGRLSLDDRVVSFFPDEKPADCANLRAMQVRHLLMMGTGHAEDATGRMQANNDGNWVAGFLSLPVEHTPGTHFVYNSAATYMLSAIVQQLTGTTVLEYLRPRLFAPLGIANPTWESCPRGISVGGWGLSIRTEDIARFGQLYLQQGMWHGQRLLPPEWVQLATSKHISNGTQPDNDWQQGYGFQFWRCRPRNVYRGDGAFGQYCIVMPDQDAVLAITSGLADMQAPLNLVWNKLLPAMKDAALPSDRTAERELSNTLSSLTIPPVPGHPSSTDTASPATMRSRTYTLDANDQQIKSLTFEFTPQADTLTTLDATGRHPLLFGHGRWIRGWLAEPGRSRPVAACAAWTAPDTWTAKVQYCDAPFSVTHTCRFTGNAVTIDSKLNVAFGPTERPRLIGHAVE